MAVWECGTCDADFRSYQELETHQTESHRQRKPDDLSYPASAREKPLGPQAPAPEAQDLRTGRAGDMDKEREDEAPHPTKLPGEDPPPREEKPGSR